MDFAAIFALVEKGITVATALLEAGQSAIPALEAIKTFVTGAKTGSVSDVDLAKTEALLDQMIDDFNLDL